MFVNNLEIMSTIRIFEQNNIMKRKRVASMNKRNFLYSHNEKSFPCQPMDKLTNHTHGCANKFIYMK